MSLRRYGPNSRTQRFTYLYVFLIVSNSPLAHTVALDSAPPRGLLGERMAVRETQAARPRSSWLNPVTPPFVQVACTYHCSYPTMLTHARPKLAGVKRLLKAASHFTWNVSSHIVSRSTRTELHLRRLSCHSFLVTWNARTKSEWTSRDPNSTGALPPF